MSHQTTRGFDEGDFWGTFLVIAILFAIFAFVSGKNVAITTYTLTVFAILCERLRRSHWLRATVIALFVSTLISIASPIDVDFRGSAGGSVRLLPVVYNLGSGQQVRELVASGKREDVDFIVIGRSPWLNPIRYSLVIFYPR